jgi:hypothetical protein
MYDIAGAVRRPADDSSSDDEAEISRSRKYKKPEVDILPSWTKSKNIVR